MAEGTSYGSSSSSGSEKASAQQTTPAQEKTDTALQEERVEGQEGIETTDEGVQYPTSQAPPAKQELLDEVTYRDPRPLDWPQKADRSVFIGAVHSIEQDDDGSEKDGYVYAGRVREEEELKVGGDKVETAQVLAGGGHLNLILNGQMHNLGQLSGPISADLLKALENNANS